MLTGLGVIGTVLIALTAATAKPGDPALYPVGHGRPGIVVYVTDNGFHADLNVPTAELASGEGAAAQAIRTLRPRAWTVLGWGDAKFYQGEGAGPERLPDLLRAALPGNPSVVHLGGTDDPLLDETRPRTVRLTLSRPGLAKLRARLDAAFLTRDGAPVPITRGADLSAVFFAGSARASLAHNCNHWTAELLHAAGAPTTAVLDTVSAGLNLDLQLRAHAVPITSSVPSARAAVDPATSGEQTPHRAGQDRSAGTW